MFEAWAKFRRGKRTRTDVLGFENNLEKHIFELRAELKSQSYQHGRYEPFIVWDPKQRRIHKATVRDRLVHQAVVNIIEPLFEQSFIYDSFSCRKGKGTHAGVKRLGKFLRQSSRNNSKPVYALKCDIKQFFASVSHIKLLDLLSIKITDEKTLDLLEEVINSFSITTGRGIPLGNLTSQLFANVYMHELDFFIKHNLNEKYYIRYCDDFVIVSADRQHLTKLIEPISQFLRTELGLSLHPSKITIRSWDQGIDFLGYVLKPHCVVLRTKTKHRLLWLANSQNLSSYLGVLSHADTYQLRQELLTKLWLDREMLE